MTNERKAAPDATEEAEEAETVREAFLKRISSRFREETKSGRAVIIGGHRRPESGQK
jgi:hypothetical protein